MDENGSYFEEYLHLANKVGLSWQTKERIEELVSKTCPAVQLQNYEPARIDNHQDVYVYQKSSEPST